MNIWQDELLPASFRGVEFFVEANTIKFGRRLQTNSYPFDDTPNTTDLGRSPYTYTVNAFLIGDESLEFAAVLIAAITDLNTPGLLTLPTATPMMVNPTEECQADFSDQESRIVRFKLTFVEAGQDIFPGIGNNSAVQAAIEAAAAAAAIAGDFQSRYKASGLPDFVGNQSKTQFGDFSAGTAKAAQSGVSTQASFSELNTQIVEFNKNLENNYDDPVKISNSSVDLIQSLSGIYDDPQDAFNAQLNLITFGNNYPPIFVNTPSSQQQSDNQDAVINLIQNVAITQLVSTAAKIKFASRQDALAVLDMIGATVKAVLFRLGDQNNAIQFAALSDAFAKIVIDIKTRSATLANVITIQTKAVTPATLFSYNFYGNLENTDDLVKRNNIVHPSFIPSGTNLEVLA